MMKKILCFMCAVCCLLTALAVPAAALEYTIAAPDDHLFGRPTSDNTISVTTDEPANVDRSKSAARIPPTFGSPTSYTLNAGELLTPNLVQNGQIYTGGGSTSLVPSLPGMDNGGSSSTTGYTPVIDSLYYSSGHLATLSIPSIDLSVKVYEGTSDSSLAKGVGHFENTSIWDGNVGLAGHNRGVNTYFGKIHTLDPGDTIQLTTKLGTRTYCVTSVEKILSTKVSVLDATAQNQLTLITCVVNEPSYRWCVTAAQK